MKYSTKEFSTNKKTGIPEDGGIVSGSVLLNELSKTTYQAATKEYVEQKREVLSGEQFVSGYLINTTLPSFTGDLVKGEGSSLIGLTGGVVVPGTYTKCLVNEKGQVTLGMVLAETDLPDLPFSIIANKPNSLSGYNINNALPITGGNMLGTLKVTSCNDLTDLANKDIADYYKMDTNIEIGTYVYKINKTQTPFFLRCNGSDVLISMYEGLYGVIGDSFSVEFTPGFGLSHIHQADFNTSTNTTASWSSQSTIPATRNSGQALVTKNKVYLIGGSSTVNTTGSVSTIYVSTINVSTGVIGSWSVYGNLPVALDSFELVVYLNRVYLIGGNSNGTIVSTIYSSLIDSEGNLGSWSVIGELPFVLKSMSCIITKNLLTCMGGQRTSGVVINVMQCPINEDGTLGTWYSCPSLPGGRHSASILPTKNWVYLIGGNSGSTSVNTVLRAPLLPTGLIGDWSTYGTIPAQRQESRIVSSGGRVYLLGGGTSSSSGTANTVYSATINGDGSLGSWGTNTNLAEATRNAFIFITNSRLYICGGYRSTTRLTSVRYTNFVGGLNDYSEWYSENKRATSPGYFRLPYKESELLGTECFIRC